MIMGLYGKTLPKFRQYSMRITANAWMPAGNMLEIGLEKYGLRLCRKYSSKSDLARLEGQVAKLEGGSQRAAEAR